VKLYCPLCRTELEVEPTLDKLEVFSGSTLVVTWLDTRIEHACPDPTPDPATYELHHADVWRS
jgi:hypothetical protein